jgi:hypothetical protein
VVSWIFSWALVISWRIQPGGLVASAAGWLQRALRRGIQLRPLGRPRTAAQAGIAVYERGTGGLLAAARVCDDVDAPFPDS